MRPHISIRGLVRPLVRSLVGHAFVKIDEKWPFLSDLDSDGRGEWKDKDFVKKSGSMTHS